jgi:hypothetical protein
MKLIFFPKDIKNDKKTTGILCLPSIYKFNPRRRAIIRSAEIHSGGWSSKQ